MAQRSGSSGNRASDFVSWFSEWFSGWRERSQGRLGAANGQHTCSGTLAISATGGITWCAAGSTAYDPDYCDGVAPRRSGWN